MFRPKTDRVKELARKFPARIAELEKIFDRPTNVYIDFANVIRWQNKLGWHFDLKRLKQLCDSFDTIREVKYYSGTLVGDERSEHSVREVRSFGYIVVTKPVKIMRIPIDASSIPLDSPDILKEFIRAPLLQKLNVETLQYLNARLKELNRQGIRYIEDLKCNFDVEIGRDMTVDHHENKADKFVLWSGDSDFADPVRQLLDDQRQVVLFATARKVSRELNDLKSKGLFIFDIQKIRDFICWSKEIAKG